MKHEEKVNSKCATLRKELVDFENKHYEYIGMSRPSFNILHKTKYVSKHVIVHVAYVHTTISLHKQYRSNPRLDTAVT
jgi:hypothetical protein